MGWGGGMGWRWGGLEWRDGDRLVGYWMEKWDGDGDGIEERDVKGLRWWDGDGTGWGRDGVGWGDPAASPQPRCPHGRAEGLGPGEVTRHFPAESAAVTPFPALRLHNAVPPPTPSSPHPPNSFPHRSTRSSAASESQPTRPRPGGPRPLVPAPRPRRPPHAVPPSSRDSQP